MLVSFAEKKTGECVVCCHRCGAFLMESASTTSYMVFLTKIVMKKNKAKLEAEYIETKRR